MRSGIAPDEDQGVDKIVEELQELRSVLQRIESNTGFFPRIVEFILVVAIVAAVVLVAVVTHRN